MEQPTTTTQSLREKLGFTRVGAINSDSLVCDQDTPTVFIQVMTDSFDVTESKRGINQFHLEVINLETGRPTKLWVGGQLRSQFERYMEEGKTLKGEKFEIVYKGKADVANEDTGETYKANQYKVFLLATAL